MTDDSAISYTYVHFKARSWSIPSQDPYEEAAQQLFEQAPRSPDYVPRDHIPVFVLAPDHPEGLVLAEDEAPASLLPPGFLSPRSRPLSPRALVTETRAILSSIYPAGTPPLLPIPSHAPPTSRRAEIPKADAPPLRFITPRPGCEVGESSAAAAARQPGPTMEIGLRDAESRMVTAIELVNMRVSYQADVCTRESLEFYTQQDDARKDRAALRAEIGAHRQEWQRQAADDFAVQHIMRTQVLEAGACIDTMEDTGSRS
ncbi:hypothetical protein Tco_0483969 [Tanacetum coccineum]